jgi:hypothetical protein
MIYKTFEQWKSGNVLEHGVPRTEYYSEDQLDLVEMGWNYGYDAGRAVEQSLDKKAENAKELGLDYEPVLKDNSNYRYDPPVAAPVQSCYCPNCEAMGKELAALKAQPAPVQDIEHCIWARNGNTPCPHTTQPAAQPAVQEPFCFYYVENGEEYFAPKGAYVPDNAQPLYTTPPAQPAVPDALSPKDENPAYAAGWNDCRAEMLKGMKP